MVLPLDTLEECLNGPMVVTLRDGRTVEGRLAGYDQHMNLVLEEARERHRNEERTLGTIVLRGTNIVAMGKP